MLIILNYLVAIFLCVIVVLCKVYIILMALLSIWPGHSPGNWSPAPSWSWLMAEVLQGCMKLEDQPLEPSPDFPTSSFRRINECFLDEEGILVLNMTGTRLHWVWSWRLSYLMLQLYQCLLPGGKWSLLRRFVQQAHLHLLLTVAFVLLAVAVLCVWW